MKRYIGLILALVFVLTACGHSTSTWQEQYDLGVRYLSEGKYEEAILAFTAAIEIDPKKPEAYLGAADAYVSTGDKQAGIMILEQGFDSTADSEIRSRLDELTLPQNLTGQEIFTPSVLDEWEYPYGIDIYEMAERGICDQEDVEELLQDRADPNRMENYGYTSNIVKWHPEVSVYVYNGLLNSVDIGNGDTDIGPRGVRLGMSLEEVLNKFYCENEAALAYAESLDPNCFPEVGADSYPTLQLYNMTDEEYGWKENSIYSAYMGLSDESHVKLMYECSAFHGNYIANCNLLIELQDGFVTRMGVVGC